MLVVDIPTGDIGASEHPTGGTRTETLTMRQATQRGCLSSLLGDRDHRVHIFTRDETESVCLPTQLERTLQLYW
jgi:hypothetical protein